MWRMKVFSSSSFLEIGILAEDITTNTAIIWKICRKRNRGVGRFLAVGVALLYISFSEAIWPARYSLASRRRVSRWE